MKELWDMFFTFARIGGLTFGGGYAMLPMLQKEVVENKGWARAEEIMDYYAISQCLPGIIAVNTATFIGQRRRGVCGGIAAALGVVFPSLVIIVTIAAFIGNFAHLDIVRDAFAGIKVCVCALIFNAVLKLWKKAVVDRKTLAIFFTVFLGTSFTALSPILFVLLSALAGILISNWKGKAI